VRRLADLFPGYRSAGEVARSVVDITDRLSKVANISSPVLRVLRNTAVELIGNIPFATHTRFLKNLLS
jgi:hypothetical protein